MRIDKEELKRLSTLPDDALWREIRRMAAERNFTLPDVAPTHDELSRLRAAIADVDRIRISDALRVLNDYQKRAKR